MATAQKRAQPATHISVWIGLGLSILGLLIAMYAYSGTRVYDIAYAYLAIAGGVVSLGGILVSAWGRSIMAARAQRMKRETIQKDALLLTQAGLTETRAPPTIAEPAEKKRFAFSMPSRKARNATPTVEGGASSGTVFAFRSSRQEAAPAPPAQSEVRTLDLQAIDDLVADPIALDAPARERITLKCPSCASQFSAEGIRPFAATCPSCGFSASI